MPAANGSNYNLQKCWQQMLTIGNFGNAGDKCEQLQSFEMLAIHVSNSNFEKCWQQMLTTRNFRNAGDASASDAFATFELMN